MNTLPRLLGFSLVLLLVFLAAALTAQAWLRGQNERLRDAAIETKRQQFMVALPLLQPAEADGRLSDDQAGVLGGLLGAEVSLVPVGTDEVSVENGRLGFSVPAGTGQQALVRFSAPATDRLLFLHQRVLMVLLLLALVLLAALAIVLVARPGSSAESGSHAPWGYAKAEMGHLQQLVKNSVSQGAELARERDVRQRAEEESLLRQNMLNQVLEEKIRMGRDLHDGLIQSLYATGLTLESARDLLASDPAAAGQRVQASMDLVNTSIRNVRNYITGLTPGNVRKESFARTLKALTDQLGSGREVGFELTIDDIAAALLSDEQLSQCVQIVHEAVSNALRHGGAGKVTVRLHAGDHAVGLLVQDDGRGFSPDRLEPTGHGLANMQARAKSAGGTLQLESTPGAGTRIVLTLPVVTSA